MASAARRALIEELNHKLRKCEGSRRLSAPIVSPEESWGKPLRSAVISTGLAPLDQLLPAGGLRRGTLVEWLAAEEGSGAGTLALWTASQALKAGGVLVVLDPAGDFYVPAAAARGIELEQLIVVRPRTRADFGWAYEQALRCPGVTAVWGAVRRLDPRAFRRWQLAAEQGGGLGLLLRPLAAQAEPTWAEVRFRVETRGSEEISGRRLQIAVLRCPGGMDGQSLCLEIDDETGDVRVVSELAPATPLRRLSGA